MSGRAERIALALALCLPVPVLAASGLAVPLPSIVERVAAALVPFASSDALASAVLTSGRTGSIVALPDEGYGGSAAPASASPTTNQDPAPGREPAEQPTDTTSANATRTDLSVEPTTSPYAPGRPTDEGGPESPEQDPAGPGDEVAPPVDPEPPLPGEPDPPPPADPPSGGDTEPKPEPEPTDEDTKPRDEADTPSSDLPDPPPADLPGLPPVDPPKLPPVDVPVLPPKLPDVDLAPPPADDGSRG